MSPRPILRATKVLEESQPDVKLHRGGVLSHDVVATQHLEAVGILVQVDHLGAVALTDVGVARAHAVRTNGRPSESRQQPQAKSAVAALTSRPT